MFTIGIRGQSSSVFNLLIAALVSLAILGLLLSVLGGIDFGGTSNPTDVSIKLLKNASQTNFNPQTDTITLSKKYNTITTKALASKLDVGEDIQIIKCIDDDSVDISETLLKYSGSADKKFTATAICGDGEIDPEQDAGISQNENCESPSNDNDGFGCYLFIRPFKG